MLSAEKFYDYADEHFGWAETAKTERERAILLQMAAAWLEVAQRWETSEETRVPSGMTMRVSVRAHIPLGAFPPPPRVLASTFRTDEAYHRPPARRRCETEEDWGGKRNGW